MLLKNLLELPILYKNNYKVIFLYLLKFIIILFETFLLVFNVKFIMIINKIYNIKKE